MSISEKFRIKHSKCKNLTRLEKSILVKRGRSDGIKGLPKEDANGEWISPFIYEEKHSCQEESNKLWGLLQIELEQTYAEIDALIDKMTKSIRTIENKKNVYSEIQNSEALNVRKKGEEDLSESVVRSRREKEQERKISPIKADIGRIEKEMESAYERLIELRGIALEKTNATKITAQKIEEHTFQRINAYWNAAYEKHPIKDKMPPIAKVDISSSGEETYRNSHRNIDDRMVNLLTREQRTMIQVINNKEVA